MKNKLLKLREDLHIRKGERTELLGVWVEPNQDYYTDYAIKSLLSISDMYPNRNLLEEARDGISSSLASNQQTCYFWEYSEGYRAVYEYLKQ